jgi:hypothetical protein
MSFSNIAPFWKGSGNPSENRILQKTSWTADITTAISPEDTSIVLNHLSHSPPASPTTSICSDKASRRCSTYSKRSINTSNISIEMTQAPVSVHATFVGSNGSSSSLSVSPDTHSTRHAIASQSLQQLYKHSEQVSLMDENVSMEALAEALDTQLSTEPIKEKHLGTHTRSSSILSQQSIRTTSTAS